RAGVRRYGPGRRADAAAEPALVPPGAAELPQPPGASRPGADRRDADIGRGAGGRAHACHARAAPRPERAGPPGKGRAGPLRAHPDPAGPSRAGGKVHRGRAGSPERPGGDTARRATAPRPPPGIPAPGHAGGRGPGGLRLHPEPAGLRRAARRVLRHAGGGGRVHGAGALPPGAPVPAEDRLREPGEPRAAHAAHLDPDVHRDPGPGPGEGARADPGGAGASPEGDRASLGDDRASPRLGASRVRAPAVPEGSPHGAADRRRLAGRLPCPAAGQPGGPPLPGGRGAAGGGRRSRGAVRRAPESLIQRLQVLGRREAHRAPGRREERRRGHRGGGPRRGDCQARPEARLRPVLPGGQPLDAADRGLGPGPLHQPAHRGGSRRQAHRAERARQGQHLHPPPAGGAGGAGVSQQKPRVLVVEDDLSILTGVSMNLRFEGYEVLQAQDGAQGLELAVSDAPDLIVLDVMMPKVNGYEVLRELRSRGVRTPVLVLSAKGMERDKVLGLDLGADDYVVKPFGVAELMARVKAVLRRRWGDDGEVIRFGDVAVNLVTRAVTRSAAPVDLTAQEFKLLAHLVSNPGRNFSREELLSGAWGIDYEGTPRTVDTFVRQLRQKLEPDPEAPRYILTARGLGYRFERPQG